MSPMSDTGELHIEKVTPGNVTAACRRSVRPDQQEFVAPVAWSLAEAYASPGVAWTVPRRDRRSARTGCAMTADEWTVQRHLAVTPDAIARYERFIALAAQCGPFSAATST